MDKGKKLRRYNRKDYTQIVEFPVEIVGRDGIVRRYSFEASIRLYQRRIASAPNRYDDTDVVDAEVRHCRQRIEQLRKSYFHRYGWSAMRRDETVAGLEGPLAGEFAAFLRRFYGDGPSPREITIRQVHGSDILTYQVQLDGSPIAYLVYLYDFESSGDCSQRELFFQFLRMVQLAQGDDVEALVAFHHTADCGLVMTTPGRYAVESKAAMDAKEEPEADLVEHYLGRPSESPYTDGVRLLAEGDPVGALAYFEDALAENPYRRQAALGVVIVADSLGRNDAAETGARIGVHSFPDDPVFHYHLGVAQVRAGASDAGRDAFDAAILRSPELFSALGFRALLHIQRSDYRAAVRDLRAARACARPEDADVVELLAGIERALSVRLLMLGTGLAVTVIGAVLLLLGFSQGVLAGGGLLITLLGGLVARVLLRRIAHPERVAELRLVPPEGLGGRGPRLDDVVI